MWTLNRGRDTTSLLANPHAFPAFMAYILKNPVKIILKWASLRASHWQTSTARWLTAGQHNPFRGVLGRAVMGRAHRLLGRHTKPRTELYACPAPPPPSSHLPAVQTKRKGSRVRHGEINKGKRASAPPPPRVWLPPSLVAAACPPSRHLRRPGEPYRILEHLLGSALVPIPFLPRFLLRRESQPKPRRPPRCAGAMKLKPGMSALVTGGGSGIGNNCLSPCAVSWVRFCVVLQLGSHWPDWSQKAEVLSAPARFESMFQTLYPSFFTHITRSNSSYLFFKGKRFALLLHERVYL
jgi:hypothetical protein